MSYNQIALFLGDKSFNDSGEMGIILQIAS